MISEFCQDLFAERIGGKEFGLEPEKNIIHGIGYIRNARLVQFNRKQIISWYEDDKICYVDDVNESKQTMDTLDGFSVGDYKFVSDGNGNSSVVYTITGENKH